jgi:hypothetical protein
MALSSLSLRAPNRVTLRTPTRAVAARTPLRGACPRRNLPPPNSSGFAVYDVPGGVHAPCEHAYALDVAKRVPSDGQVTSHLEATWQVPRWAPTGLSEWQT